LAGFDVTSYSVVATNTDNTSSSSDENKAGLIAGLTIGLFAFAGNLSVIQLLLLSLFSAISREEIKMLTHLIRFLRKKLFLRLLLDLNMLILK